MLTERIVREALRFQRKAGKATGVGFLGLLQCPLAIGLSDGETGYAVIDPEIVRVMLFVGERNLQGYLRLIDHAQKDFEKGGDPLPCYVTPDTTYFQLSMTGSSSLTPDEEKLCRACIVSAGIGQQYPVLRLMEPHLVGQEVRDGASLTRVEEMLCAVNAYLAEGRKGTLPSAQQLLSAGILLQLIPAGGAYQPRFLPRPMTREAVCPLQQVPEQMQGLLDTLSSQPRRGTWEMMLIDTPPYECLTADGNPIPSCTHGRGMNTSLFCVLSGSARAQEIDHGVVQDFARHPEHLLQALTEQFLKIHTCPQEILVADLHTEMLLRQWCSRIGAKIRRVPDLPTIRRLTQAGDAMGEMFADAMRQEQESGTADPHMTELMHQLAADAEQQLRTRSDAEIRSMPAQVREIMEMLAAMGLLSAEAVRRLHGEKAQSTKKSSTPPQAQKGTADGHRDAAEKKNAGGRKEAAEDRKAAEGQGERVRVRQVGGSQRIPGDERTFHAVRRGNTVTMEPDPYPGSVVFSVSAGRGCYRHLQVSRNLTLAEFATAILDAFDVADQSRSHAFELRLGGGIFTLCRRPEDFGSPRPKNPPLTSQMYLAGIGGLREGSRLTFVYDLDAGQRFTCKVLRISDEDLTKTRVLRRVGTYSAQ